VKLSEQQVFLKHFGKNFASLRRKSGFSQEQLAYDSDVSLSSISKLERGAINLSIVNLYKLSKILNIHYKELLNFELDATLKF
jgi:transcriptional regulator with XRE-family HTH domain